MRFPMLLLELLFTSVIETLDVFSGEIAKANFRAIARGGVSTEYLFLTCYVDYAVSEYLLGDGPASMTVAYDHRGEMASYELYRLDHATRWLGDEPLMSEAAWFMSYFNSAGS